MNDQSDRVQSLLSNSTVQEFLETHAGAKKEVQRAAEFLKGKPDAEAALIKLLPSLDAKEINVFFSYKKKDERTAKTIVDTLRKGSNQLKISFQAEFTEQIAGQQWRQKIRDDIGRANWFILLLPDPSDDWDWCLYETGLFDREMTSADKLICLHHPDTSIPDQIEGYHAIAAEIPEMERWLSNVFVADNPIPGLDPLAPFIADNLPEIAKTLVQAIRPAEETVTHRPLLPQVTLKLDDTTDSVGPDQLAEAEILEANSEALNLFDFLNAPKTWGKLTSEIEAKSGDLRWQKELCDALSKIKGGRKPPPLHAAFRMKDDRTFRAVPSAVNRRGDGGPIKSYDITFLEVHGVLDHTAMPADLSTLATLMRLAFRFRWEVLKRFARTDLTDDDIGRLENAMIDIEAESESRGVVDQESVVALFPADQREKLDGMMTHWNELRDRENNTGLLDKAMEAKDKDKIASLLKDLFPMNEDFLRITATHFAALATGEPPEGKVG